MLSLLIASAVSVIALVHWAYGGWGGWERRVRAATPGAAPAVDEQIEDESEEDEDEQGSTAYEWVLLQKMATLRKQLEDCDAKRLYFQDAIEWHEAEKARDATKIRELEQTLAEERKISAELVNRVEYYTKRDRWGAAFLSPDNNYVIWPQH